MNNVIDGFLDLDYYILFLHILFFTVVELVALEVWTKMADMLIRSPDGIGDRRLQYHSIARPRLLLYGRQ
jgi:hypothetical protein